MWNLGSVTAPRKHTHKMHQNAQKCVEICTCSEMLWVSCTFSRPRGCLRAPQEAHPSMTRQDLMGPVTPVSDVSALVERKSPSKATFRLRSAFPSMKCLRILSNCDMQQPLAWSIHLRYMGTPTRQQITSSFPFLQAAHNSAWLYVYVLVGSGPDRIKPRVCQVPRSWKLWFPDLKLDLMPFFFWDSSRFCTF